MRDLRSKESLPEVFCILLGILVMPPFKRGDRQFSVKENKDGYMCASVRIHVERCIRRLKVFQSLKFIPMKMMPHFNKILIVVAFLTNCQNDLIKSGEEEDNCDDSDAA